MKKIVDMFEYKLEKEMIEEKENNTKLFKRLVTTQVKDLTNDELEIYADIQMLFVFIYRDVHRVLAVNFRDNIYIINNLGDGTFEYLGTLEEILDTYVLYK